MEYGNMYIYLLSKYKYKSTKRKKLNDPREKNKDSHEKSKVRTETYARWRRVHARAVAIVTGLTKAPLDLFASSSAVRGSISTRDIARVTRAMCA